MVSLSTTDPVAIALTKAVHAGDVSELKGLLGANPGLASARIADRRGALRTPLHVASDWPGYFPNGPVVVRLLAGAGGDPNAPMMGAKRSEERRVGKECRL